MLLVSIGGAGGGGRIAIYASVDGTNNFTGTISAYSGIYQFADHPTPFIPSGSAVAYNSWLDVDPPASGAGCGSVYLSYTDSTLFLADYGPSIINVSYVNNIAHVSETLSVDLPKGFTDLTADAAFLDKLVLQGGVNFRIKTGLHSHITNILSDSEGSIVVEEGGFLNLPKSFIADNVRLQLFGSLLGVQNLTLSNNSDFSFAPISSVAVNRSSQVISTASLESLNISQGCVLRVAGGNNYQNVSFQMILSSLYVASGGEITASGQGYEGDFAPYQSVSSATTSAGLTDIPQGSGGSHAGSGGGQSANSSRAMGCAFSPSTFGEGGGTNSVFQGGAGGGALRIIVDNLLYLDGIISADGENCPGGSAGGGAGGSVWITSSFLFGSGIDIKSITFGKQSFKLQALYQHLVVQDAQAVGAVDLVVEFLSG